MHIALLSINKSPAYRELRTGVLATIWARFAGETQHRRDVRLEVHPKMHMFSRP
jgi:hypothetical protein